MGSGILLPERDQTGGRVQNADLNASAPIFGLIGAVIFLAERPTRRNIVGTLDRLRRDRPGRLSAPRRRSRAGRTIRRTDVAAVGWL